MLRKIFGVLFLFLSLAGTAIATETAKPSPAYPNHFSFLALFLEKFKLPADADFSRGLKLEITTSQSDGRLAYDVRLDYDWQTKSFRPSVAANGAPRFSIKYIADTVDGPVTICAVKDVSPTVEVCSCDVTQRNVKGKDEWAVEVTVIEKVSTDLIHFYELKTFKTIAELKPDQKELVTRGWNSPEEPTEQP